MPLALVPPKPGHSTFYSVQGSHFGRHVECSTGTYYWGVARKFLQRLEKQIETEIKPHLRRNEDESCPTCGKPFVTVPPEHSPV